AAWFRIKYPHVIDGAVAASAPVLSFVGESPPANLTAFSQLVTYDASPAAGSAANCAANVKRVWDVLFDAATTAAGRASIQDGLGLCSALLSEDDALSVPEWAKTSFVYLAMGNFPYPSSYIMNGGSGLPAFPVREACKPFAPTFPLTEAGNFSLLVALRASVGVYYNSTHDQPCYTRSAPSNESQMDADFWDYLFCSELYQPQDQGIGDMFWLDVHDQTADAARCLAKWGVTLRPEWATTVYGGRKALRASSNIVFSNGNLDPWAGMGVLEDLNPSVVAVRVEGGAHHLDLMFSHPLDPPGVKRARQEELKHVAKWIQQAKAASARRRLVFDSLASSGDCCVAQEDDMQARQTAASLADGANGKKRRLIEPPSLATDKRAARRQSPVVMLDSDEEDQAVYLSPEPTTSTSNAHVAVSPQPKVIDLTLDDDDDDDDGEEEADSASEGEDDAEDKVHRQDLIDADLFFDLTDESPTPMLGRSEALRHLGLAYAEVDEDDRDVYKVSDEIVRNEMAACADVSDVVRTASQADLIFMTTYGEIQEQDFSTTIIPLLQLRESDVFYDLGCGTGKPVLQVALETTCRVSKGMELFANRVEIGQRALGRLRANCPDVLEHKRVVIVQGDIVRPPDEANLVDATVVFINNLVFTDDLMLAVMDKMRHMRHLRRLIVSKKLCGRHSAKQCKRSACTLFDHPPREAKVNGTWAAKEITVYVYVRTYTA
ncbi:hypothetical protein DYB31_007097, partial [Aphanomyces astaci]